MDKEGLKQIHDRVIELNKTLTGHWSETDQQMLHDLYGEYIILEANKNMWEHDYKECFQDLLKWQIENRKLNEDKNKLLEQGLSLKEYFSKYELERLIQWGYAYEDVSMQDNIDSKLFNKIKELINRD